MKVFTNTILIATAGIALAACTQCPKTSDYKNIPYAPERTAGEGTAVYDTSCPVVEERAETVTTTATPAPAPQAYEPIKAGEPVMSESQRK